MSTHVRIDHQRKFNCRNGRSATKLTGNTPAQRYQKQKLIHNTVRVPSSLYSMNLGALNVYQSPSAKTYGVNWNQASDRTNPHLQPAGSSGGTIQEEIAPSVLLLVFDLAHWLLEEQVSILNTILMTDTLLASKERNLFVNKQFQTLSQKMKFHLIELLLFTVEKCSSLVLLKSVYVNLTPTENCYIAELEVHVLLPKCMKSLRKPNRRTLFVLLYAMPKRTNITDILPVIAFYYNVNKELPAEIFFLCYNFE